MVNGHSNPLGLPPLAPPPVGHTRNAPPQVIPHGPLRHAKRSANPHVPFDNNTAERAIRPAVIIRKNSYGNRSQRGADCQAVLMSIFRTLKQRGHDPIRTVLHALVH